MAESRHACPPESHFLVAITHHCRSQEHLHLLVINDLHVAHQGNADIVSRLRPVHPGDWPSVAGDVAEESRVVLDMSAELRQYLVYVIWVPGSHKLWTHPLDRNDRRGGMSLSLVQPTVTMPSSSTTTRRCGTVWVQRFNSSSGSPDADVTRVTSLSLPIGSWRHTDDVALKDWNILTVDYDLESDHMVSIIGDVN